ncbi:hypothetical protein M422DRAFT_48243 [Sphaerobolus stellatus SS14]|uniref:BTB domain-containing protein n=1 Tax=Sphaerobolus stellatus (strain SS14) TaxID=990650 RepID=A0A0C9VV46_SPHS4|nr:hypothetical protein M422DRAFT_48243 [Sphaerobolus stellatus SS14]
MNTEQIRKDSTVYYPNGDIVLLSVPEDDVRTAFKVDKVFLSRFSDVFQDMFEFPPGQAVREVYDEVPLVQMQDSAVHLRQFLLALYKPYSLPTKLHHQDAVDQVKGILILAPKYQVEDLYKHVMDLFEADWPTTFDDWKANAAIRQTTLEASYKDRPDEMEVEAADPCVPDPCVAIALARQCNVTSILPAAFYDLLHIAGKPWVILHQHVSEGDSYSSRTTQLNLLSKEDLIRLFVGKEALKIIFDHEVNTLQENVIYNASKNYIHAESDHDQNACAEKLRKFADVFGNNVIVGRSYLDIMRVYNQMVREQNTDDELSCWLMKSKFKAGLEGIMRRLWARLPELFWLREEDTVADTSRLQLSLE